MENPLISIIIPAYNAVKYIEATIESCLHQTYTNIEIIIQDDCSTDGTWELAIQLYSTNNRVRLYRNEHNLGIGDNWNAAYQKIKGDFLLIFNADDLIVPDMIEKYLAIFSTDSSIDIVSGKFEVLISATGKTTLYADHISMYGGIVTDFFERLFFRSTFHWNFSLTRRSFIEKVELPEHLLFLNTQICDYELWYRCYLSGAKLYFDDTKIWGYYRKHETNNSYKRNGELRSFLRDFLHYHLPTFKKRAGSRLPRRLARNFISFCNSGRNFELDVFFLYLKRISQSLI